MEGDYLRHKLIVYIRSIFSIPTERDPSKFGCITDKEVVKEISVTETQLVSRV